MVDTILVEKAEITQGDVQMTMYSKHSDHGCCGSRNPLCCDVTQLFNLTVFLNLLKLLASLPPEPL